MPAYAEIFTTGLAIQRVAEPRLGFAYNVPKSGTVLRASYARTQETPFNENLVLSSQGCYDPVLNAILSNVGPCNPAPFNPGFRNEFHTGVQQSIGRHFVLDAEYIWKYTHSGFDFSVLGATPITFPIAWHNSKIPGWTLSGTPHAGQGTVGARDNVVRGGAILQPADRWCWRNRWCARRISVPHRS